MVKIKNIYVGDHAERVVAGLKPLSLERPSCQVGPWLVSGNLVVKSSLH